MPGPRVIRVRDMHPLASRKLLDRGERESVGSLHVQVRGTYCVDGDEVLVDPWHTLPPESPQLRPLLGRVPHLHTHTGHLDGERLWLDGFPVLSGGV